MSLHLSPEMSVWLGACLTLCIFSFLYKDNPFYRFAEHLFVGVSAGYYIILNFWTGIVPNLVEPLYRHLVRPRSVDRGAVHPGAPRTLQRGAR